MRLTAHAERETTRRGEETPDWEEAFSRRPRRKRPRFKLPFYFHNRFVFTDNRHPLTGIFAAVLAVLSAAAVVLAIVLSYRAGGQTPMNVAASVGLAGLYALAAVALGIYARFQKNVYRFFPDLGITLGLIDLLLILALFLLGAYA